ncbi:MAG: rhodanese-like domain-containing protein [Verrucomicrobiota bacterium]|nr:rhodanese-like domain-containing protein [Verrucomicrobiota bacterium]
MINWKITLVLGVVLLCAVVALAGQGFGWRLVNAKIHREFPDVPRITTAELADWLHDPARPAPLLLDVRTPAEFEVSHLKNAERIAPDALASAVHQPKDRPIVTYCSVGYRSGGLAEKLRGAGFTHVSNLEGSIFAWANEGRPVYAGAAKVTKVHPFNHVWGLLLHEPLRADVPAVGKEKP